MFLFYIKLYITFKNKVDHFHLNVFNETILDISERFTNI